MSYHQRKLSIGARARAVADLFGQPERADGTCTQDGCDSPPAEDNCLCERHRDEHRLRQRACAKGRRYAQKHQLELPVEDT